MEGDVPEAILCECPDCEDVTEHAILKGRFGNSNITGTFRCRACGRVFTGTIRLPRNVPVKVFISDGDVTHNTHTILREDEIVSVGDEFDLEDGRHVKVTYVERTDGSRRQSVQAPEISALWVVSFGALRVKVSVNDCRRTYPMYVEAEPDDEFTVGMVMHFDRWDAVIHAIKTRNRLIRKGTAEARDVVRIYGKKLRGNAKPGVLDEGESLNESLYDDAMDLDEARSGGPALLFGEEVLEHVGDVFRAHDMGGSLFRVGVGRVEGHGCSAAFEHGYVRERITYRGGSLLGSPVPLHEHADGFALVLKVDDLDAFASEVALRIGLDVVGGDVIEAVLAR